MTEAAEFLAARDARQRELDRVLAMAAPAGAVLLIGANVHGAHKQRPGLAHLTHAALEALTTELDLSPAVSGFDLLGPYHLATCAGSPERAKEAAVALEAAQAAGRILDVDVFRADGTQLGRAQLGLPARPCLLCPEPAADCARLGRHDQDALLAEVDRLILGARSVPGQLLPEALAAALHLGAKAELDLTPKPGLVDRLDNGSHPDLSHESMLASVQLLPRYYGELLQKAGRDAGLDDMVASGLAAEQLMFREIGSNTHAGYIFLSGLVLLAACQSRGHLPELRPAIADLAGRFFAKHPPLATHGAEVRNRFALGGILAEAERGLPAVFEHGWPAYRDALAAGWTPEHAGFLLMAVLMQHLEDTTAVRRCGLDGLARLRRDGASLQRLLESDQHPELFLEELNEAYRRDNLTMGGVADCMALTFAVHAAAV